MSNISFDMSANDQNVEKTLVQQQKEIAKLTAEVEKLRAKTTENTKVSQDAAKAAAEQNKLAAEAQKVISATRTETERHAQSVARLDELKQKGLLTEEQYNRALAAETAGLQSTKDAQAAAAKATAEHNRELEESRKVIDGLKTPQDRYKERVERLNQLRDKGLLTTEQHTAAIAKEGAALDSNAKSTTTFGESMKLAGTNLATMVAGFVSLASVIQLLRTEWDAMLERQGRARDATVELARAEEKLIDNLGGADLGNIRDRLKGLSKQQGIDQASLTNALNDTMSAKADMSVDQVYSAVETASGLNKLDPSKIPATAAAILDVQKQTGLGTKESLGFLRQLQAQSRVKSFDALAQNSTAAIGSVMEFGADRQTSAAMIAALSHGMTDTTGATSKTAAIQLAKQLEEFGGRGSSISETIATIQKDPAVFDEFMKGANFEAQALPAVRSMLGGGVQQRQYLSARDAFMQAPETAVDQALAAREQSPAIMIAEQQQALKNIINQIQLKDTAGAESAVARDFLTEFGKELGDSVVEQFLRGVTRDVQSKGLLTFDDMATDVDSRANLAMADAARNGDIQGISSAMAMRELAQELRRQNDRFEARHNAGAMAGKARDQRER